MTDRVLRLAILPLCITSIFGFALILTPKEKVDEGQQAAEGEGESESGATMMQPPLLRHVEPGRLEFQDSSSIASDSQPAPMNHLPGESFSPDTDREGVHFESAHRQPERATSESARIGLPTHRQSDDASIAANDRTTASLPEFGSASVRREDFEHESDASSTQPSRRGSASSGLSLQGPQASNSNEHRPLVEGPASRSPESYAVERTEQPGLNRPTNEQIIANDSLVADPIGYRPNAGNQSRAPQTVTGERYDTSGFPSIEAELPTRALSNSGVDGGAMAGSDERGGMPPLSGQVASPLETPIAPRPVVIPPHFLSRIGEQLEYAVVLARKGAMYSSRDQLINALQMIADARDLSSQSNASKIALSKALTAIAEADDFFDETTASGQPAIGLDRIIDRHTTPVLKERRDLRHSNVAATHYYYEYAGRELVTAFGFEPLAAETLYTLGKVEIMPALLANDAHPAPDPKAAVFFQAAVQIDPRHHRSANELAVQYARVGDLMTAKRLLLMSIATQPSMAAWNNLGFVHDQIGEYQLAQLARSEAARMGAVAQTGGAPGNGVGVPQFVPVAQFSDSPMPGMGPQQSGMTARVNQPNMSRAYQPPTGQQPHVAQEPTAARPFWQFWD